MSVEHGRCQLFSRNGTEFKSFHPLNQSIAAKLKNHSAVIEGRLCPGRRRKAARRGEPRLCPFDLPWCDGYDLRYSRLIERKLKLRAILPESDRTFRRAQLRLRVGRTVQPFRDSDPCRLW